jgi:RNA polymerase sigma-70 factor (ECF subfamily)
MGVLLAPPVFWETRPEGGHPGVLRTIKHTQRIVLMPADRNLETLMARYQAGDFTAASALIEMVSPQLHRFFVVQFASRADADDLLQETWLRIHKVRHTYRQGEPVLPWFYGIARYVRIDHYRKVVRSAGREDSLDETSTPSARVASDKMESDSLEALLAVLPDSQREVVEMLKVEGLSLEEVARATSSTVGSVKQKAHRAYQKLRDAIGSLDRKKSQRGQET